MSRSRARADALTTAIDATDLPGLIAEHYPDAKAHANRPGLVFAAWRGNKNSPAVSLSRVKGRWLWKDHATSEGGSAFEWLVQAQGMDRQEAAEYLVERAGLGDTAASDRASSASEGSKPHSYHPVPTDLLAAFLELPAGVVSAMAGRGFTPELVKRYGIRSDNGKDALIPITSPDGVIMQVKRRIDGATERKYRYEIEGYGSPAWCSDNSRRAPTLLIVEGELSAIIAHAALQAAGHADIGVMGVAGANTPIYPGLSRGKRVLVYADDDEAGEKARAAWSLAAHEDGARSVHVMPPHREDFCDMAGKHGLAALNEMLDAMRVAADQVYGVSDRILGTTTVREVMDTTKRFLDGGVLHGTGFSEVDRATGGVREAGIYSIAALSSMGKSAAARRFWLQQIREGGTVRVYSPDQSATSIYRLVANQLSGVGVEEIRTKNYSRDAIKLWGNADAAKAAWWEVYEWVLTELSQRLQVSEESRVQEIVKDMQRAVDEGVTMFGIDYMQMISGADDGEQSTELMAASRRLGVPIVSTLQLAKYKYPPTRVSGIPVPGDIQGAGAYFQDSEMVFMLYNEEIYAAKYAGDAWRGDGDSPGMARLLLVKDKEGRGNDSWPIRWDGRLAAYTDAGLYDLTYERKGLMD